MSYYASDEEIGGAHFEGETVPSTDTIPTARNTSLKMRANNKINGTVKSSSQMSDPYGDLKEIFLKLYKLGLDGESMILDEADENLLVDRYGGLSAGGVPVIIHDFDDWNVNENG